MADLCLQCGQGEVGAPPGWSDFGWSREPHREVLCEGCGWITVDHGGACVTHDEHPPAWEDVEDEPTGEGA